MNGTSGLLEMRSSTSRSPRFTSGASHSVNSEKFQAPFSILGFSSLSPQASAQTEKRFLTPFSLPYRRRPAASRLNRPDWKRKDIN
jgi:hypothetical protein